jgi:hypothetical protein
MEVTWSIFKSVVDERSLSIQWIDIDDHYYMKVIDGNFILDCKLHKSGPDTASVEDFEDNYKTVGNRSPKGEVKTQFERDDLTIKIARIKETIVDGTARVELLVPGTPGTTEGRYLAGGYGMLNSFDPDDHLTCTVEDIDRMIAWTVALTINPAAEEPVSDATVQAMGDYPSYPVIGSYTDDEVPSDNQGWYFWPLSLGGSNDPIGEVELEPLGFYGFVPAGFYIVFTVIRPNVSGGIIRGDIIWGKKE